MTYGPNFLAAIFIQAHRYPHVGFAAQEENGLMQVLPAITSFIGTEITAGSNGFDLIRPQDGKTIGRIDEAGDAGVDAAVKAAKEAFAANRKAPTHQRIAWLKAGAMALIRNAEVLAATICEDVGKPIRVSKFEGRRGAEFMEATGAALAQMTARCCRSILRQPANATSASRVAIPTVLLRGSYRSTRRSIY